MAQFSSGFNNDWENELDNPKRPITPDEFTSDISSQDTGFTETLAPRGIPQTGFVPLNKETQAAVDRAAADAEKAKKDKEREAEKLAKQQQTTQVKQQREAGVEMQTSDTGQTVPKTTESGALVYNPGWTGAPKYDPDKKSWTRDFRDDTGKVATRDLWDEGDIKRDENTGELYLNMPGGARQTVGKDEDFLKRQALGQEITKITRQEEANRIDLANQKAALAPLQGEIKDKEDVFKKAVDIVDGLNKRALSQPDILKSASYAKIRDAAEQAKKEWLPLRAKKEAVEKRDQEVTLAKNAADARQLDLHTQRDTIEAARRRPDFAAPSQPSPTESPDVTAERQTHGIAGDSYRFPDSKSEVVAMQKTLADLDTQLKIAGPDKIPELIQQKKTAINTTMGRKAALDRYNAQDVSLEAQAKGVEAAIEKRNAGLANNNMWAHALFRGPKYQEWLTKEETAIASSGQKRSDLRGTQNELKKKTWQALQQPSDFPETLLTRSPDGKVDLNPTAVSLRVSGRAAAFHSDPRDEMAAVLDEIQKGGKIHTIGGRPIKESQQLLTRQRDIMPEDLMTRADAQQIQKGLRGPLVSHGSELFRDPKADIAKPGEVSPEEQNRQFFTNLLFGSKPEKSVAAQRQEIQSRDIKTAIPNYAQLPPAERKKAIQEFLDKKNKDLEAIGAVGEKPLEMVGPDGRQIPNVAKAAFEDLQARGKAVALGAPRGFAEVLAMVMNTQALSQSMLAGSGKAKTALRQVVGAVAPSFANPLMAGEVKPEDHPFHTTAVTLRDVMSKAQGDYADSFMSQVAQGVGTSAAFAPAAMVGGMPGVALFGAVAGYGDGYFDAKAKAQAQGKTMPEWQAHLNGLAGAGLNATEGIPLAHGLERLEKATGGQLRRLLNTAAQGAEEFGQEAAQQATQAFVDKVQGFDERDWKTILGDSATQATPALMAGLLMGLGMNAADQSLSRARATDATATFTSLDRTYTDLVNAVKSPEALDAYNSRSQKQPITLETATAVLGKIEGARNQSALSVIQNSDDTHAALKALLPKGDPDQFIASIVNRPGVLAETIALGRDLGPMVVPEESREAWLKPQGPQADLIRHVLAGREVLNQLEGVAKGDAVPLALGQQLEAQGLLIQKPTDTGSKWVVTMPAVSLFDGKTRDAIAKAPDKFAVEPTANTAKVGALTTELKQSGDAELTNRLTKSSISQSSPLTGEKQAGIGKYATQGPGAAQAVQRGLSSEAQRQSQRQEASGEQQSAALRNIPTGVGLEIPSGLQDVRGETPGVSGLPPSGSEGQDVGRNVVSSGAIQHGNNPAGNKEMRGFVRELPQEVALGQEEEVGPQLGRQESVGDVQLATFRVKLQSAPEKSGFTAVRTLSVQAETPEQAEQLAYEQAKTNRWKGDWQPIQVSPVKGASQQYSKENEAVPVIPGVLRQGSGKAGSGSVPGAAAGPVNAPAAAVSAAEPGSKDSGNRPGQVVQPGAGEAAPAGKESGTGIPDAARAWAGRELDDKDLKKAFQKLGVVFTAKSKFGTKAEMHKGGLISLNHDPTQTLGVKGDEYDNASLSEEIKHAAELMVLRREWEEAGKPGDFVEWAHQRSAEILNDLLDRIGSLEGAERKQVEDALINSFNLYFSKFEDGKLIADSIEHIKKFIEDKRISPTEVPINPYSVVGEFARQLVQLREADSITETTLGRLAKHVLRWMEKVLGELKNLALTIGSEGGVLQGTQLEQMVLDMEDTLRRLDKLMGDAAAQAESESVDTYHENPLVQALIDMGGILSRTAAEKKWSADKWAKNKSIWDDAPKLGNPKHNSIYNPESGLSPDEAAGYLAEAGLLPQGSSANELWQALGQISNSALSARQPIAPDSFRADMQAQRQWIVEKAKTAGFQSVGEMLQRAPRLFAKMAQDWRDQHSLAARKPIDTATGDLFAQPQPAAAVIEKPRTIETVGEGNLFSNTELPFNLQGQVDTGPQRQAAIDARNAEAERRRAVEQAQVTMFARKPVINGVSSEQIFESAKNRHGITNDIEEAGYVLPDGTLLDFTGRADVGHDYEKGPDLRFHLKRSSERDWMKGKRAVDHREIQWEGMPDYKENWDPMVDFMRLGAIRVGATASQILIHGRFHPTAKQMHWLRVLVHQSGGAALDLEDDDGKRASIMIEGPKWPKVSGLIHRWANGDNLEKETQRGTMFARRPIGAEMPLTIQDGLQGASTEQEKLFRANMGYAVKIADSFNRNGDNEDLRQEAFIALTRAARTYDASKGPFNRYAGTVIRNHLSSLYGRAQKQIVPESLEQPAGDEQTLGDTIPGQGPNARDEAERRESVTILREVIASLPQQEKAVVTRRMAGQNQTQAAAAMGYSKEWISNVEKAAMTRIRQRLTARGITELPRALHARQPIAPFYSKLERTIEQKMPKVAVSAQAKAIVAGGGIKAEEVKWSGVMPAIDRIAQENGGKVPKQALTDYLKADGAVRLEEVNLGKVPVPAHLEEWKRLAMASRYEKPTKFSQYQLPGGENYREVVLAMPVQIKTELPDGYVLKETYGGRWGVYGSGPEGAPEQRYGSGETQQEALNKFYELHGGTQFKSSHFPDVPNYVAHARMNDRVDAEGKPGAFIEELQSDRHQQGREKGYVGELPPGFTVEEFQPELGPQKWQVKAPDGRQVYSAPTEKEAVEGYGQRNAQIPLAPFRKDWPLQMFKRALRDAVEAGKQWIGWTTGDTQAERYDLSKQVDTITVQKSSEQQGGGYFLKVGKGGELIHSEGVLNEAKLADVIGKELAQKAVSEIESTGRGVSYKGQDLKIGGEGMKGFYDTILPNEIGKYVKQWGAKVEKDAVRTGSFADAVPEHRKATTPIWRVSITPEMTKGVEAGQPLFARRRIAEHQDLGITMNPQPSEGTIPSGQGTQQTMTQLDREMFRRMGTEDQSRSQQLLTDDEVNAIADSLVRDSEEIGRRIGENPEDPAATGPKVSFKDLVNAHLVGRFDKMNYFAPGSGDVLLAAHRSAADYAAAVRMFLDNLEEKVQDAFGHPSYWRHPLNRLKLEKFKNEMLPYAAFLNAVARDDDGALVFEDFWQRAGEASDAQLEKLYHRAPGDEWRETNGERWRIGKWVVPDPKKPDKGFYQVERFIPAAAQELHHANFHDLYPEAAFLLDDFIEPGMENERVVSPHGIELPSFNRHSLYGVYGDTPLGLVEKLPAYTPDVARTKSIGGYVAKLLKLDWKSPGRDYKSGQARVTGNVENLFKGFNIRAAQAHMETVRRDTAEKLLKATVKDVPPEGVPANFVALDRGALNPLVRALREMQKKSQMEIPEITASTRDRMTERDLKTVELLFGDPELFSEKLMIHKTVMAELRRAFVKLRFDHEFLDAITRWVRGSVTGVLADFQTISMNKLSAYVSHTMMTMHRVNYAAFLAMAGEKQEATAAIRTAGFLVKGFFTNFYHPKIRERMDRLVPPEHYSRDGFIQLMQGEDAEKSAVELLKEVNVGGALLKAVGYGDMDPHAKQKVALASMLSRASIAADSAGITGADRKAWEHKWIEGLPSDHQARLEAELAAKLYHHDYANVPWWLDEGHKVEIAGSDITPVVNLARSLIIPFWKYPYNYARQVKRIVGNSAKTLAIDSWRKPGGITKIEGADAAAHLMSYAMLLTAFWLMFKPWGDDDEPILGTDVNDQGEPLDPKFRTGSRLRLAPSSVAGMAVNTVLKMFGADTANNDHWVRMRTMPYATQAMAIGAAWRWLTSWFSGSKEDKGNAKSAVSASWNIMEDFMSIGSGAKMGLAALGFRDDYTRYQDVPFILGQGGFDMATGRVLPPRALKDIATLVDPINRRYTKADSLDYYPGPVEGVMSRIPGVTKFLPPSGTVRASAKPGGNAAEAARAELEARGLSSGYNEFVDKAGELKAAYVDPEKLYEIPSWKAAVRQSGFNVKAVPKDQYQKALAGE